MTDSLSKSSDVVVRATELRVGDEMRYPCTTLWVTVAKITGHVRKRLTFADGTILELDPDHRVTVRR